MENHASAIITDDIRGYAETRDVYFGFAACCKLFITSLLSFIVTAQSYYHPSQSKYDYFPSF
jgi:hypothetical protein